jgi:hypothetical protein
MSCTEREQWTFIDHSSPSNMSTENTQTPAAATSEPNIEVTINTKSKDDNITSSDKKKPDTCTCPVHPTLNRTDTSDFNNSELFDAEEELMPRSRPHRRGPVHPYSPTPPGFYPPGPQGRQLWSPETVHISSSAVLLSQVGKFDGLATLPFPARNSVYLATFPFGDRDTKKYAKMFVNGTEEHWPTESSANPNVDSWNEYPGTMNSGYTRPAPYDPNNSEVPSLFLSRALDPAVIPEKHEHQVQYWIVVQRRSRARGAKLLVADTRKGAAMLVFHEALLGNSVVFVGAAVIGEKGRNELRGVKFNRMENFGEAVKLTVKADGREIGVIC